VFSIGPMIIVIIYVAGLIYGRDAIQGNVFQQLQSMVGVDVAAQVQELIKSAALNKSGPIAAAIGIATLVIGATSVFAEIQDSINMIWGLKPKPKKSWLKYIINRLLSFVLVLALGFLLVLSLIASTLLSVLDKKLRIHFPNYTVYLISTVNIIVLLISITSLFMVIYKVLPDAIISWRDALVGALFTSLLFLAGRYLIGIYLARSNMDVTYGTAASIIVILVWVYYSSIILYFGAEFTKAFALESGHGIRTKSTAVFIIKREEKEIPQSRLM